MTECYTAKKNWTPILMSNNSFQTIFDNRAVRIVLISTLAVLTLFLLAQTITIVENFGQSGMSSTDTITVRGDGQVTLPPDVARISFTVENTAKTITAAQAATTKQVNAAIDFVKGQGIADKDIKTLSYNISPQYSYPNPCSSGTLCQPYSGTPKIVGYQVSEMVQVTIHDLATTGTLVNGLGTLGVQNVQGPEFALDDATSGYDAARADAIDNAKTQAVLLAGQLGISLGKIVNFSESSGGSPIPIYAAMTAGSASGASTPNIQIGENTYNASVSITYEIRQ